MRLIPVFTAGMLVGSLAAQVPADIAPGAAVRLSRTGFCFDWLSGFRCLKHRTRGIVQQASGDTVIVTVDKPTKGVDRSQERVTSFVWTPELEKVKLELLTGHRGYRTDRALLAGAVLVPLGYVAGRAFYSYACLFCDEAEGHRVMSIGGWVGIAVGALEAFAFGFRGAGDVWTPVKPRAAKITAIVSPTRLGMHIQF
jgi:hypothetical protein